MFDIGCSTIEMAFSSGRRSSKPSGPAWGLMKTLRPLNQRDYHDLTARSMHWSELSHRGVRVGRRRRPASAFLATATLLVLVNCASSRTPSVQIADDTPEGHIAFDVWMVGTREPIVGANVSGVTKNGWVSLGKTDTRGRLTVEARALNDLEPHVIVFCHDLFFCGALPVDDRFYGYREHNVGLSPFSID
jgi:hypothetical protein